MFSFTCFYFTTVCVFHVYVCLSLSCLSLKLIWASQPEINELIDSLVQWLIRWLIDWFVDSFVDSFIDWSEQFFTSLILNTCSKGTQLKFQILQGSAATDLKWHGKLYSSFFCSSPLNMTVTVKELIKSVHICHSYHKNKSHTFFYGLLCRLKCCIAAVSAVCCSFARHGLAGQARIWWRFPFSDIFARDSIYAKRAYAITIPSVRLSVRPSHGWFMQKRL